MGKKIRHEDFIRSCEKIHNHKYDYSKTIYVNSRTSIIVICPIHGEYSVGAREHKRGHNCPKCSRIEMSQKSTLTTEEFIKRSNRYHQNKYDYTLSTYTGTDNKVTIICPTHGEFSQTAGLHMYKSGCPKCVTHKNYTTQTVIDKFRQQHGDKYDYSLVDYKDTITEVKILCRTHGEFNMKPAVHLNGCGCQKCGNNYRLTTEEYITKCMLTHGAKYDYSKVNYVSAHKKIKIICPIHGEFSQTPNSHVRGSGCPTCKESIGERYIRLFLESNNLLYENEVRFDECRSTNTLPFDFYLPKHNILIEFHGIQHYTPIDKFGGVEGFIATKKRDKIKWGYCLSDNNPNLLIIPYWDIKEISDILNDILLIAESENNPKYCKLPISK